MPDTSYGPKVYKKDGGDTQIVASGGTCEHESGGTLKLDSGAILVDGGATVYSAALALCKRVSASIAQLNASGGLTVLAAVAGKTYTVWGVKLCARGGAAAACTGIGVHDTASTPVQLASVPVAVLTQDQWVSELAAAATGEKIGQAATSAKGVAVEKIGSNITTASTVDIIIVYTIA